jgi:hypothetical protein
VVAVSQARMDPYLRSPIASPWFPYQNLLIGVSPLGTTHEFQRAPCLTLRILFYSLLFLITPFRSFPLFQLSLSLSLSLLLLMRNSSPFLCSDRFGRWVGWMGSMGRGGTHRLFVLVLSVCFVLILEVSKKSTFYFYVWFDLTFHNSIKVCRS